MTTGRINDVPRAMRQTTLACTWTTLGSVLAILLLIELLVRASGVPRYLVPSPLLVASELVSNGSMILHHLTFTAAAALGGFAAALVVGAIIAAAFALLGPVRRVGLPLAIAMQAIPLVALAPFIHLWFGYGIAGKSALAGLLCVFPCVIILTDALSRVDRDTSRFYLSLGASRFALFRHVALPAAVPGLLSATKLCTSLSMVGAIVAEMVGASRGAGHLIVRASYEFDTPRLFAVLAASSALTVTAYVTVDLLGRRLSRRFHFASTALEPSTVL